MSGSFPSVRTRGRSGDSRDLKTREEGSAPCSCSAAGAWESHRRARVGLWSSSETHCVNYADCAARPEGTSRFWSGRSPLRVHPVLWQPHRHGRVPFLEEGLLGIPSSKKEVPHQVRKCALPLAVNTQLTESLVLRSLTNYTILATSYIVPVQAGRPDEI